MTKHKGSITESRCDINKLRHRSSDEAIVLTPVTDVASKLATDVLHRKGSRHVSFWEHEGYRISQSLDPSGPNGEGEWHVAVSKDQKPVSWNIAEVYASKLLRHVKHWQRYDCSGTATHLFESKS